MTIHVTSQHVCSFFTAPPLQGGMLTSVLVSAMALGLPFLLALADKGWRQACADDAHLLAGLNVHAGHLTYSAVGAALGLEVMAPARALAA
jgi:alanine dehydrogenase